MKKLYILLYFISITLALFAEDYRYTYRYFDQLDSVKNVEFATAPHLNNVLSMASSFDVEVHEGEDSVKNVSLYMDIYMPQGDTLTKRPLVLMAHQGGFLRGERNDAEMHFWCTELARAGYVTATFDYRLGMGSDVTWYTNPQTGEKLAITSITVKKENVRRAVYRAVQDSRAAIRFLKSQASTYQIDTSKVYMLGSSAGAFIAIHNQYFRAQTDLPDGVFDTPSLLGLDAYGPQGYGAIADAYISLWGAVFKTNLLQNSNAPALLVHGTADEVVPFMGGYSLKSLIPSYPTLTFNIDSSYGSYCMDTA